MPRCGFSDLGLYAHPGLTRRLNNRSVLVLHDQPASATLYSNECPDVPFCTMLHSIGRGEGTHGLVTVPTATSSVANRISMSSTVSVVPFEKGLMHGPHILKRLFAASIATSI